MRQIPSPLKPLCQKVEALKKEGRSLNRNEMSWLQKCVAGTKQERRETLVVQSGKIVASLFSHTSSLAAMKMIL
jgi:hypothetical protein